MDAKRLTKLAMLTGIALIIFVVELQIPNPFPIPGVKLGLANIVTVSFIITGQRKWHSLYSCEYFLLPFSAGISWRCRTAYLAVCFVWPGCFF